MSIRDRNYWIEKAKEKFLWNEKQSDDAVKQIMFIFDETAFEVEDRINSLYQRYASDNNLSLSEARKLISDKEYSVWKKSIDEYMNEISENAANSKITLELNTLAMKSRISREEKLLADIYKQMAELAGDYETDLTSLLGDITLSNYYKGCYNLQMGMKVGFEVGKISDNTLKSILSYNWSGKNYSKAVWDNVDAICANAQRTIMRGFTAGYSVQKMAREIDEVMDKGRYVAERLVRTESKYFANQGEMLSYKEDGIEKYVYMGGSEGSYTCDCPFYNNKIIPVSEAVAGVNFPPLHPNCKCSIRPYFEDSILDNNKDCIPIDEDMTLDEWKKQFVVEIPELQCEVDGVIMNLKMSKHLLERLDERGITLESVKDAMEHPLFVSDVVYDDHNRPSEKRIGKLTTATWNPETQYMPTAWKTGTKTRKKYEKE